MDKLELDNARLLVDLALKEDFGSRGDITTKAICPDKNVIHAKIIAKQSGTVCGLELVNLVFNTLDDSVQCLHHVQDGDLVEKYTAIMSLSGPADVLLSGERTALNFLGRLSGIATKSQEYYNVIKHTNTIILDTRKTTPGWRLLEKYAVRCGKCRNHRTGLYDMFLIKDNHITKAGGITNAVNLCRKYMQLNAFIAQIEVEAKNLGEVKEALALNIDRIMLDNMTFAGQRECVEFVNGKLPLEASGNVDQKNIKQTAETGVQFISIGAITHSAPNFDYSMLFD